MFCNFKEKMTEQKLTIPIDAIKADFNEFLTPESNKRIIFSGPFGIGKTYFLDKFFRKENKGYLPIFLRPVNYSLLSNEDVFKLIKYDILYQLILFPEFEIEKEFKLTKGEYTKFFFRDYGFSTLSNLLKLIPKIQTTVDSFEKIGELITAYKEGLENIKQTDELTKLFDFQNETQANFLLEYDNASQYISWKLEEISKKDTNQENLKKVLIIDDLDRLDPEHIFRLFNVFSAHFDQAKYYSSNEENIPDNKFGFDKIIFVCDIENIRKIFAHKYGKGVDFSGYIDKFYSSQVYHFNKNKIVLDYVDQIFKSYENSSPQKGGSQDQILTFIKPIFIDLINANAINHRVIENIDKNRTNFKDPYTVNFWNPLFSRNYEFVFIQVLDFLYDIFGKNYEALYEAIEKASCLKKNTTNQLINRHIKHLLPLLSLKTIDEDSQQSWHFEPNRPSLSFKIAKDENECIVANIVSSEYSWITHQNYYRFLLIVIENLKAIGVFEFNPE